MPTIRSTNCEFLLSCDREFSRCVSCTKIRTLLRLSSLRFASLSDPVVKANRTDTCSHVNHRFLNLSECHEKMRKQHLKIRLMQQNIKVLNMKISKQVEQQGVIVGSETHKDICSIMDNAKQAMLDMYPEGTFQRLFWEQQNEAAGKKKTCGMRWHPLMLKWCLYLHYKSSGAYQMLRESGCLKLPSQRTLREYRHIGTASQGFSRLLDEQLMKAAEIDTLELWQKCVILILDEMSIHEDLVYDKHSGELIGYTNLGDINNHLLAFEKSLSDPGPPEIANSMLMFMVQGLFIPLQFPYCQFPCCSVTGDLLFKPIWEAVYRIERCGFQVHDPCTVW